MQPSKPRANLNQLRHQHYQPLISGGASSYPRSGPAPEESPSINAAGSHLPEIAHHGVEQMEMFNGVSAAVNADLRQNQQSQAMPAAKSQRQVNGRVVQENEIKLQEAIQQNETLRQMY